MFCTLLLALVIVQVPVVATDAPAKIDGFRFAPGRQNVGRVYHYQKSNKDGSNPSHVDIYVASDKRIESFKYHAGIPQATLVTADMDWKTFSVEHFETTRRGAGGSSQAVASLDVESDQLHGKMMGTEFTTKIGHFPWHTYDFDLASLNIALRYLSDPEGIVELGFMDVVLGKFKFKGTVEFQYLDDEKRGQYDCRRYWIDGPGLENRGGLVWVRKGDDPVIVDYEIDLPDESSMKSGKMVLVSTAELTREQWDAHMLAALK